MVQMILFFFFPTKALSIDPCLSQNYSACYYLRKVFLLLRVVLIVL